MPHRHGDPLRNIPYPTLLLLILFGATVTMVETIYSTIRDSSGLTESWLTKITIP